MSKRTMNRDNTCDVFRTAVLSALDEAANQTFDPPRNDSGATDEDLVRLFKAIDAQVDVLAKRYNVTWAEIEED